MKVAERVLDVDSTLTGENVRMGIDEHAIQHIIGVLTDLYSDPERAVIREYSTNALDSNVEAGNGAAIEVTTPTSLAPFFRVKDTGIGMDAEDIRNIYSRYGTSTKRDSDEQVGMLGLGAKSALTYTDQFTLIGTKNGRQVQVQIGRDEDGGGSMTIVSDEPTDEPNGVEVIIPAKRTNAFEDKAKDFFEFWKPGTVLVNGEAPQHIAEKVSPTWLIPDKLFIYRGDQNRYRQDMGWVVMGNVAYPIPEDTNYFDDRWGRKFTVVAFVDIGEVNFTPSREALMLTKRTKETLARIAEDVKRELLKAAQKKVATAQTPAEAIAFANEAAAMGVKTGDLKYQGRDVPTELARVDKQTNLGEFGPGNSYLVLSTTYRGRKNGERWRAIPPYNSKREVFTGYDSKELSPTKRDKLEQWYTNRSASQPAELVFVDSLSADEKFWLTGTPIHDWTPVSEIKLEKSGTVGKSWNSRPRGSYEQAHYHGGGHIEADTIDTSKPVLWLPPDERYLKYDIPDNSTVIVLPANRQAKFLRDFPDAMRVTEYIRKEAKNWLDQQDPKLVEIAKYQISGVGTGLEYLSAARVDDPDLAAAIEKQNAKVRELVSGIEKRKRSLQGFDRYELQAKYPHPFKKYPLLSNRALTLSGAEEHVYLYVNAAYAA